MTQTKWTLWDAVNGILLALILGVVLSGWEGYILVSIRENGLEGPLGGRGGVMAAVLTPILPLFFLCGLAFSVFSLVSQSLAERNHKTLGRWIGAIAASAYVMSCVYLITSEIRGAAWVFGDSLYMIAGIGFSLLVLGNLVRALLKGDRSSRK